MTSRYTLKFSLLKLFRNDHEFVCYFLSSSLAADIKPEDLKYGLPNTNLIDKEDDLCRAKTQDIPKDCVQTWNAQGVQSSQQLMDYGSAAGLEQLDSTSDRDYLTETQLVSDNGQKSKRPSVPGRQPAKAACVAADSPNPKLILCLNNSPRKDVSTPSDVEMLSPTSPVSKSTFINCSDKDQDCATGGQDSSFAISQEVDSQHFYRDDNSGCSSKQTEDADIAESRGACGLIQSPSFANVER